MPDVIETNLTTDPPTITERDFTATEIAQQAEDKAANTKAEKDKAAQEKATETATAAAIAHAKSLGFTDAMIAAMYPNLGA